MYFENAIVFAKSIEEGISLLQSVSEKPPYGKFVFYDRLNKFKLQPQFQIFTYLKWFCMLIYLFGRLFVCYSLFLC